MRLIATALIVFTSFAPSAAQDYRNPWLRWSTAQPDWVEQIEPFRIIGNVYFVGTRGLSSFLITSDEGHFLLDGALPQSAPTIKKNIEHLGFRMADVKILLNSHAHFDHSGGLQALKEMSGAQMLASEGDRSALEGGFYLGFEDRHEYNAPPVKVDRIIEDGEQLTLGATSLKAHLTPGHTRGCTSFTMTAIEAGNPYEVLFFCGATVAANKLNPPQYDGIVDDYRFTFDRTRSWQPDVFLVNHPFFFDMAAKRERQQGGDPLAFVDREGFPRLISGLEKSFENSLRQQQP